MSCHIDCQEPIIEWSTKLAFQRYTSFFHPLEPSLSIGQDLRMVALTFDLLIVMMIMLMAMIMIMIIFLEPSLDDDGINLLLNFSKEGNSLLLSAKKKIT